MVEILVPFSMKGKFISESHKNILKCMNVDKKRGLVYKIKGLGGCKRNREL